MVGNGRVANAQTSAGVVSDPQTMALLGPDSTIGDVDVGKAGIGEHAFSVRAAWRHDAQTIGDAIFDA